MVKTELYFGRTIGINGYVSDIQWNQFLQNVVTLYFPDGFTTLTGTGQWKMENGDIVKERTMIVIILHDNTGFANDNITLIKNAYCRRFHQESVMRIDSKVSVQF